MTDEDRSADVVELQTWLEQKAGEARSAAIAAARRAIARAAERKGGVASGG